MADFATSISELLTPFFPAEFRKQYPHFKFITHVTNTEWLVPALIAGESKTHTTRHVEAHVVFADASGEARLSVQASEHSNLVVPSCEDMTMDRAKFLYKTACVLPPNQEWDCQFAEEENESAADEPGDDDEDDSVGIIIDVQQAIKKSKGVKIEDGKTVVWHFAPSKDDANCSLLEMRLDEHGLFTKDVGGEEREFTPEGIFRRVCKRKTPILVPATPPPRSESPDI